MLEKISHEHKKPRTLAGLGFYGGEIETAKQKCL